MIAPVRRLLLLPAVTLLLLAGPVLALDGPSLPRPTTTRVPLLSVGVTAADAGWSAQADVEADLVGVTWTGDPNAEFRIEARFGNGDWQTAGDLGPVDLGPDDGTGEAASATAARRSDNPNASEPVWLGGADAVRVTVVGGSADAVTLEAVSTEEVTAPSGSAGALALSLPHAVDRAGFALAFVLAGVGLTAVALGWSPWRSRRQAAVLIVVGLLAPAAASHAAIPNQPAMTMRIQWGGDLGWNPSPDCAPGPVIASGLKFAVVHHTVNSNIYSPTQSTAIVRSIWQYHVGTLGYCDIAYNFLIDRYGQTFEGRMGGIDRAVIAAHTGGFNTASTGAAWIGTWTTEQPPPAAWDAMVNLLAWKLSRHRVNPGASFTTTSNGGGSRWPAGTVVSFANAILGHRDLWPTECPGDAFSPRMAELRQAVQPKVGWSVGWEPLGGVLTSGPAVAAWSENRLDVFIRGTDNQLWHKWWAGTWSHWEPLGGTLTSGPAVAAWSAGRLDVFINGTDNQLWHKWYDGTWSHWEPLGGTLTSAPAVTAWSAGRLDVFINGTDNQLWHKWWAGTWSHWEPLGGILTSGPAVVAWSAGRLDVFVRGTDNQLWHEWYDGTWSHWEPLGGTLTSAPAVAAWSAGRLDVFINGTDNQLWHKWWAGTWSHWEQLGGVFMDDPAAAAWSAGRLDVFVKGTDSQLLHAWYQVAWFP